MSTQKNAVSETPSTSYVQAAQAFVEQLRAMRETIPHFVIPPEKKAHSRMTSAASVPAEFVELTAVARTNSAALVRGQSTSPTESRDLLTYADAFGPVADELEAMAQFVRFSIAAAKNKAGSEALTTYAIARRLVKRPEHADLAPHVAAMRRALGNRGKHSKAAALARKQQSSEPKKA